MAVSTLTSDAIRIVPANTPEALEAVASTQPAHLTYRGGPLLTAVAVTTIYWGSAWQSSQAALASDLDGFFDFILTSPLIDQLKEYSATISHGSHVASVKTTPAPRATVTDATIRKRLQTWISTLAAVPDPTPNSLYFVYLPPGVTVTAFGSKSCSAFCGYHDTFTGTNKAGASTPVYYAVMPYLDCQGCTMAPPRTLLDAATSVSSHELCEAITDPAPPTGWYDDANGEIGDICAWQMKQVGAYWVQKEWSNAQNACV